MHASAHFQMCYSDDMLADAAQLHLIRLSHDQDCPCQVVGAQPLLRLEQYH